MTPWSAVVAGALLATLGVVLAVRDRAVPGELVFLSPEQFDTLVAASRRAGAGRVLVVAGVLLAAVAGGGLVGGVHGARVRRTARVALGAGVGLAVLGVGLWRSARAAGLSVGGSSGSAASGPVPWVGLVVVLIGGALLGLGVSGGLRGGDSRVDQR